MIEIHKRKYLSNENSVFMRSLINLAIPITLQELIYSFVNLLDTFMIGQLGDEQITAVGLANQIFFLFILILFGINSGSSIFMSQYWGKKDIKGIHKIMGICISSGMIIGIVFGIAAFFFPLQLMRLYSKDPLVCEYGAKYLKVVAISYLYSPVTVAMNSSLKSTGETKIPMMVTILSLITNILFNTLLIYGVLGFPRLEVTGAALATTIARTVECITIIFTVYKRKLPVAGKIKSFFSFSRSYLKIFYKTTAFVVLNETFWALGVSIYNIAYKHTGTSSQTALQIATTIQNVFFVITIGIGAACAIMLGNLIGAGETETAIAYGKKFMKLTPVLGLIMGLLLIIFAPILLKLFNITQQSYELTIKIMTVFATVLSIRFLNHTIIVGILRSGADTLICFLIDVCAVWLIGIPLAFIGALVLKLPIYWIVALVFTEEIVKATFGIQRVLSKKWVNIVVKDS